MASGQRRGPGPLGWVVLCLALMVAGAAAAVWALAHYGQAARFLGVAPAQTVSARPASAEPTTAPANVAPTDDQPNDPDDARRLNLVEQRLARVENATQRVEGSAGRADALLVAFAARRAIDRGVSLGYLEPLLVERFTPTHPGAVATIITASRSPVRLDQLSDEFGALAPQIEGGGPEESVWQGVQREFRSLVSVRRADQPSTRPNATYARARARLEAGQVDQALAEAMRLPGIARAAPWVGRARGYVAAHRALDEIESTALMARAN